MNHRKETLGEEDLRRLEDFELEIESQAKNSKLIKTYACCHCDKKFDTNSASHNEVIVTLLKHMSFLRVNLLIIVMQNCSS